MFDVLNATDFVVPALEILDTRVERVDPQTKATRKIFDTIADNAANAGIVLGGRPIRPMDADLRWIGALCFRNGQLEETGLAAGVLNHPATQRGLARQQDRAERACAGSRPGGAGRIVHPPDRNPQRRHDPGRLWPLRLGELLLRLMRLRRAGVNPPCRISRSNIPPISMAASTWAPSSRWCARPRLRPASSRSAASASAPSAASTMRSPTATRSFGFLDMVLRLGEGRDLADPQEGRRTYLQGAVGPSRSGVRGQQIRAVVRHADQRQGNELEAQQHPRSPESGGRPWIRSRRKRRLSGQSRPRRAAARQAEEPTASAT